MLRCSSATLSLRPCGDSWPCGRWPDAAAEASIQQALQQELTALDEDRDFLRAVNQGVEAMSPADQQRVRDMGRNANGAIRRAYKPVF